MTLNDELLAGLGDEGLEQIAGMLGTDALTARKVVEAVSGTIVGGMARNVEHPDGADALRGALDDHMDADPFNGDVASLTRDGHSILAHVLGGQGTEQAAAGLSRLAGVSAATIMKLLPLIAPMIMSVLAGRAAGRDMDAGAVADDVHKEQSAIPCELGKLLGALLGGIFGGPSVPRQAGPYEPYRTEHEVAQDPYGRESYDRDPYGRDGPEAGSAPWGDGTEPYRAAGSEPGSAPCGDDNAESYREAGSAPYGDEAEPYRSEARGSDREPAPGTSHPDW